MNNEFLEAAIDYAELGFRVFPLQPGSKLPATENGCLDATDDVDAITETWSQAEYNIGIATDGLLVIDIDGQSNPWLRDEQERAFDLLDCSIVITPRGGSHRYYRQPEGQKYGNTASGIAPGVDTRGDGGYVVAPPSNLEGGGGYRWLPEHELMGREQLTEPPGWLLEKLKGKPSLAVSPETNGFAPPKDPIPSGQRNDTLAKLAGVMRRYNMDSNAINEALQSHNVTRCQPPLAPVEVEKIARSIGRYEPDQIATGMVENYYLQVTGGQGASPFPQELLNPPGFLSEIIDYNLAGAHRKQPILALAGALALLSVLTGRRVADEIGTRTNLFILSVAGSGSGKERARKVNKELLFNIGASKLVGPESPASASGLISAVNNSPSLLLQWDEIGRLLQAVNGKYAGPHLASVTTVLMKLYTSSDSVFLGDAYADSKKNIAINQPHAVLYGTTVPKNLYENLTADSITDGFMGRLMIFESENSTPDYEIPTNPPIPEILEVMREWLQNGGGNLSPEHPVPDVFETTAPAKEVWQNMQAECLQRERDSSNDFGPLWARASEKARKLALLHACSRGVQQVDLEAAQWGQRLAEHLTHKLAAVGNEWVAGSDHEANCKRVYRWLKEREGGASMRDVSRSMRTLKKREREEVIDHLVELGAIQREVEQTGGRPKTTLRVTNGVLTAPKAEGSKA